jgi:hypothetical protein
MAQARDSLHVSAGRLVASAPAVSPETVSQDVLDLLMSELVVKKGKAAFTQGFIITNEGRYLGLGSGFDLMREVTEMQIVAARYANPLSGLPGNVPIQEHLEHLERLLANGQTFVTAYFDLDQFKPYNAAMTSSSYSPASCARAATPNSISSDTSAATISSCCSRAWTGRYASTACWRFSITSAGPFSVPSTWKPAATTARTGAASWPFTRW